MEKKGNRNSPSTSKGSSGAELKKSQQDVINKQFTRGGTRRREPPCGFSKPQTQRNAKTSDKRPKPRGSYYTGPIPRNEEACLAELDAPELGSIFSPGSKKQSLNHLLNFSLPPRDGYHQERNVSNKGGKLLTTRKHKYNKEHFLQANCQFIVNEKGDYRQYMNNPDALVDWDLIEQVNVQVNEQSSCPICLYPPLAGKMTKCGHIYCWTCILHYLALSDKEWRKCPICFDAVKKDDLKSVIAISHKTFNINDTITFVLMKRKRGSLTAYPIDNEGQSENNLYVSDHKESCYSKLLLANIDNILEILDREKTELEVQLAEDENCPEKCFIEEASQLLEIRRNKVLQGNGKSKEKPKHGDGQGVNLLQEYDSGISSNSESQSLNSGCSGSDEGKSGGDGEFCLAESDIGAQVSKFHYFYQAADGQHIYLHAMNAKMLEHSYGSLEFGPKVIKGKILEKEGGSMTEELRKKLRYLQHLPVTCQFEVAEIQLRDPVVNKDTLEYFKEQIDLRKKRRQRREKEERKREKRIEVEENRKIGKYETPDLHIESRDQFPDVKEAHELFPDLPDNRQRTESESTYGQSEGSDLAELPSSLSNMSLEGGFTSFASMLSMEKKRTKSAWPSLQPKSARQPSPPPKVINVTGQKMAGSVIRRPNKYDSDPELDQDCEYHSPPSFTSSFGDAVAQALAKQVEHVIENDRNESKSSGKKKKRNKGRILLSSMAFPGN